MSMVPWDRHDIMPTGIGCESDRYKTKRLVEIAMAAVRACRKTSIGFEGGCEQLTALVEWAETIAIDGGPSHSEDGVDLGNENGDDPQVPPVADGIHISECAPKEARTKGRSRGGKQVVGDITSTSKTDGKRRCGYCGSLEHYSTSCEINPENACKKRGGSESLRGKMGRKRGRPPTRRQLEDEFDDVA